MIDCLNVARYFIVRAYEDGIEAEMTNMKVQKLLHCTQCLHLALYDEPLFDEVIRALGHQKLDIIERDNPAYEPVMSEVLKDALTNLSSTRINKGEVRDWLNSLLD
ncbi:MAG: hypothetical protein SAL70_04220 [Scytonema sp. PMC 1070.18]|nr:hypothetical protein [Scytonema sp. PMC 1070.18]